MSDNSDYNKPRTNLFDLLPDTHKTDVNRSVFENLFNRFLTKSETEKVAGYIGKGNPNAITKRQIHEHTIHRQGYQLQPLLYKKIGSTEHISSWYDILNELDRLGVDIERLPEWLDLQQFNWVPPIDLDKFINYKDYYWYDKDNPVSRPDYITIRNKCKVLTAFASFQQDLIEEFGETVPVIRIEESDVELENILINEVTSNNEIVVPGDVTDILKVGQFFDIVLSPYNNGTYQVASVNFIVANNASVITTNENTLMLTTNTGQIKQRAFNKLVVSGDFTRLLRPGFIFVYEDSLNLEINNTFMEVVNSTLNEDNETVLQITETFTNDLADGVISQSVSLDSALILRDCQCSDTTSITEWDVNPLKSLWNLEYIINPTIRQQMVNDRGYVDRDDLVSLIQYSTSPSGVGEENELWWNISTDQLFQYIDNQWTLIWNNFSFITKMTIGQYDFDSIADCGNKHTVPAAEQWFSSNKWYHKTEIPNFSIAKQAELPIIEYDWNLELNEWTYTTYKWKYRRLNNQVFAQTQTKPELIELMPLSKWRFDGTFIVLDESYGDLTSYFSSGREFMAVGVEEIFTVENSYYLAENEFYPNRTVIVPTTDITTSGVVPAPSGPTFESPTPLRPTETSNGDPWIGYNIHWAFDGVEQTIPAPHQPENIFNNIQLSANAVTHTSGDYEYKLSYYSQEVKILTPKDLDNGFLGVDRIELSSSLLPGSFTPLNQRAIKDSNNIRVYVNGIRQYGNYIELSQFDVYNSGDKNFVAFIEFLSGYELSQDDIVYIEAGEAAINDIGWDHVLVAVIDEQDQTEVNTQLVNLSNYHKTEQVKSELNQYPLFDMYSLDGSALYTATPIFSYLTCNTSDINFAIGKRLATDTDSSYMFQQHLLSNDDKMYAYRNYNNRVGDIWFNCDTNKLMFWTGTCWSSKIKMSTYYGEAIVSSIEPVGFLADIDKMFWYNPLTEETYQRIDSQWMLVENIIRRFDDETLQTIWVTGRNDSTKYIPKKRDWNLRTEEDFNSEKQLFVNQQIQEIQSTNPSVTDNEAESIAVKEWTVKESNHLTPQDWDGEFLGDWEIPEPWIFNPSHENRRYVSYRDIFTHFLTIIQSQPVIPGFNKNIEYMFHLLPIEDINFGLGGTIKEYNFGFDTLLSSIFVNEVTPRGVIDFAHNRYETLLNNLIELYKNNSLTALTNTSYKSLNSQSEYITNYITDLFEQNDFNNLLFGDSTTYSEKNNTGIRNWIATIPYVKTKRAEQPLLLNDKKLNINEIKHHDSHSTNYIISDNILHNIAVNLSYAKDMRAEYEDLQRPGVALYDTFGKVHPIFPPNNSTEFSNFYNTSIVNREGVYWYTSNAVDKILFRLNVLDIGTQTPPITSNVGSLWIDLTPNNEVLRILEYNEFTNTNQWNVVEGLTPGETPIRLHNGTDPFDHTTATVSAWKPVDIHQHVSSVIMDVENRLYENAPEIKELSYNLDELEQRYPLEFQAKMEELFLEYTTSKNILLPFANTEYTSSDPFTWNYTYSSPGYRFDIVTADPVENKLIVKGNAVCVIDPSSDLSCTSGVGIPFQQKTFFIKNSQVNDGTWTTRNFTPVVQYDSVRDETTIWVEGQLESSIIGTIFTGTLPSIKTDSAPNNLNDGSESAGYWKRLYQQIYNTPYPHLEPWKLQGYQSKPDWWDEEYLNNEPEKWGNRRWKYSHGFAIADVDVAKDSFFVNGNFIELFKTNHVFSIDKSDNSIHNGNWKVSKYADIQQVVTGSNGFAGIKIFGDHQTAFNDGDKICVVSNNETKVLTVKNITFSGPPANLSTIFVYDVIDNTNYNYISGSFFRPSINQTEIRIDTSYAGKNDITVNVIEGRITEAYGMWENIRVGRIPSGRAYPSGITSTTGIPQIDGHEALPTFAYFSVNVSNNVTNGDLQYGPDDLFPPYWDRIPTYPGLDSINTFDVVNRSIMQNFSTEIFLPATDYSFGNPSPVEWEWRNSSKILYDKLTTAFLLDPVRFMYKIFGHESREVGSLLVNIEKQNILSHTNTTFHGDISNNVVEKYNGINQWYVNYLRLFGFDVSTSDFRMLWTQWSNPMSYQFSTFIDTPSIDVANKNVCVSEFDYNITSKKSLGNQDYQINSIFVSTLKLPPSIAAYDNDKDWEFVVNLAANKATLDYYEVLVYPFYADPDTDLCTLYTWKIADVDTFFQTVSVFGDQTSYFKVGSTFEINGSPSGENDGTYSVSSVSYNAITNQTVISVSEDVFSLDNNSIEGKITLRDREFPWETGIKVILHSDNFMPAPLRTDDINGVYEYFIIVESPTTFRLALTFNDAKANNYVNIQSSGIGNTYVGQLSNTFGTPNTHNLWKHYEIDTSSLISQKPPFIVKGIQTLINIIDGNERYVMEQGWVINEDKTLRDPVNTSRYLGYQVEIERFIEYEFNLNQQKRDIKDTYPVSVNINTNQFTFVDGGQSVKFATGDTIAIYSKENLLPDPLYKGGRYYIIRDETNVFRIAATRNDALTNNEIDILSDPGDPLYITSGSRLNKNLPKFEINPFRTGIWFSPQVGIVSDIIDGPSTDVYNSQLLLDQYGREIDSKYIKIYREDKLTKVLIDDEIPNDVELTAVFGDPYNYIHISSLLILTSMC